MSNQEDNKDNPPHASTEEVRRLVRQLADAINVPAVPLPPLMNSAEDANRALLPDILRDPVARALFERGVRAGRAEMQREVASASPRSSRPSQQTRRAIPNPGTRHATPNPGTRHATPNPGTRHATHNPRTRYATPTPAPNPGFAVPTRSMLRPGRRVIYPPTTRAGPRPLMAFQVSRPATPRRYSANERRKREARQRAYWNKRWGVIAEETTTATTTTTTTTTATMSTATTSTATTTTAATPPGSFPPSTPAARMDEDESPTPPPAQNLDAPMEVDGLVREVEEFLSCPSSPSGAEHQPNDDPPQDQ